MDLILIFLGLIFVIIFLVCLIKFICLDIDDLDFEGREWMKEIKLVVKIFLMSICIASMFFAPLGLIIWNSILEDIYDKD